MKVEVDVLGVEQAVDFNTLEAEQFIVLDMFGSRLRVPITEEQMEALMRQAAGRKIAEGEVFDETRERGTADAGLVSEDIPVREHSLTAAEGYTGPMRELTDEAATDEERPEGILEGFFDESEEEKARKLRARKPQPRMVPRDEAGNPVVVQNALPPMQGFGGSPLSDDDGFAQG